MRFFRPGPYLLAGIMLLSIVSCENETEEFTTDTLEDFMPLQPGKYIIYRLDSMTFTEFGRVTTITKYQVKHEVDALITDNLGRPSFRVFRYMRDSAGTQPWQASGSYYVTPLADQLEVVDDNLRVIKLHLPITDGFNWKGNRYLPADPYGPIYNFSNDDNMEDWDFTYENLSSGFTYDGRTYTDVHTVEQVDEAFNVPITTPSAYAARSRSVEKYSKDIGLVYRELEIWEYQPNPGGAGGPYKTGFGITMWMIDKN